MEVKSISDCLNFIDIVIVKDIGIFSFENVREYLFERGETNFDEEGDALLCVLKHLNLIKDNSYPPYIEDQKRNYIELRRLVLKRYIEFNIKLERDREF